MEATRLPGGPHAVLVQSAGGARTHLRAARLVLAIGSPPQRRLRNSTTAAAASNTENGNLYTPSEDANLARIQRAVAALPQGKLANMLVVGSNASALEVVYLIRYRPEIRDRIGAVVVLSRSGQLPYRICEEPVPFELAALHELCGAGSFSAAALMRAITADIRRAEAADLNIADLRDAVSAAVNRGYDLLSRDEQERFVCEHGFHYSRLMRRAGRDTRNAVDALVTAGVLSTVKGEFRSLEAHPAGDGTALATYAAEDAAADVVHPTAFHITVNCGGCEDLLPSSSPLIKSLIAGGLCRVNRTERGFLVNDRLEASEDVYVIGPLVAGNFNERFRYWHVESASRIASLAKILAESLSRSLERTSAEPPAAEAVRPSLHLLSFADAKRRKDARQDIVCGGLAGQGVEGL